MFGLEDELQNNGAILSEQNSNLKKEIKDLKEKNSQLLEDKCRLEIKLDDFKFKCKKIQDLLKDND